MSAAGQKYDHLIVGAGLYGAVFAQQARAAVNHTDGDTPWTRIIEHKWFQFGRDDEGNDLPETVISREYSSRWAPGEEPHYPVNDAKNDALYLWYKALTDREKNVVFGGRLGEYRYCDMEQVIAGALDAGKRLISDR